MRILLIQYQMLGDVLTSSVLLEPLKKRYPESILDYLVDRPSLSILEGNPYVDNYIVPGPEFKTSTLAVLQLGWKLRDSKYDLIIDVYGKTRSHIITFLSKARTKIGWKKNYSSLVYDYNVERISKPVSGKSLAIENRLRLLEPLDIAAEVEMPKIHLAANEKEAARSLLMREGIDLDKPVLMISLLGSGVSKTYPLDYMAQVLDQIHQYQPEVQFLFNYLPSQIDEARQVYDLLSNSTKYQVFFDLYARNLREFLTITSHCDAMIGNEGGAINMAKALGVKSFIIFSPYLNKHNWFGKNEIQHTAVHLADYLDLSAIQGLDSKKNYLTSYRKLTPELILPDLQKFLSSL